MTRTQGPGWHASRDLVGRYVDGDPALAADVVWAVEVHLESCADCRALLATGAVGVAPLVDEVWARLAPATALAPATPARSRPFRRWVTTWATPAMAPWLAMTFVVTVFALLVDRVAGDGGPSLALLLAPVAPVAGVAAAWARGLDPAHELVAATPRAGLFLVLRRTVAVLVVVIPLLALTTMTSPVRWLLPCLAITVVTLAVGGFVGLRLAALGVVTGWVGLVVGPSVVTARPPAVFEPAALGAWACVLVVCAVVVHLRGAAFLRMDSR